MNIKKIAPKETSILKQALNTPCPLCKSTNLVPGFWTLDKGEVDSVECCDCYCGAPAESWVKRK